VLEDRRDDGAVGDAAVWITCVGGDRPKRDAQPDEAAEHRSALRALVDVLREARSLSGRERTVQRIRHRSLREAVISMHAIPRGHRRSDP